MMAALLGVSAELSDLRELLLWPFALLTERGEGHSTFLWGWVSPLNSSAARDPSVHPEERSGVAFCTFLVCNYQRRGFHCCILKLFRNSMELEERKVGE